MAAQETIWLWLILTELGLLRPDQSFTEIWVHELNKYVNTILSPAKQYQRPGNRGEIIHKQENIPQIRVIPNLLDTIHSSSTLIILKANNQSLIVLANNLVLYMHTKHIDIQHYNIWDEVMTRRINLVYIPTELILADGQTKPLSCMKFLNFINKMHKE